MSLNNTGEEVVEYLRKYFFRGSLKFSLSPEDVQLLTWEKQKLFLDATVQNRLIIKYPVNKEFCRLFFKKLIEYLEPKQEVHDDFYTYLCFVMNDNKQDDFCYRHYIISNDLSSIITTKETKNMVINGTTGMRTWEAAVILSDWALCNKEKFINKKVLELGSGVGFTGITIAKLCQIQSIILSDCHTDVLRTICENITINFPDCIREDTPKATMFKDMSRTLGVMMLDWNCIEENPSDFVPDIIIGADIVYDPTILKPLCNVIKSFVDRNKQLEVYIASVIRNEDTFKSFIQELDTMCFQYEEIKQMESVFIDWDKSVQSCLLRIQCK